MSVNRSLLAATLAACTAAKAPVDPLEPTEPAFDEALDPEEDAAVPADAAPADADALPPGDPPLGYQLWLDGALVHEDSSVDVDEIRLASTGTCSSSVLLRLNTLNDYGFVDTLPGTASSPETLGLYRTRVWVPNTPRGRSGSDVWVGDVRVREWDAEKIVIDLFDGERCNSTLTVCVPSTGFAFVTGPRRVRSYPATEDWVRWVDLATGVGLCAE